MTYIELVNKLKDLAFRHQMIVDFGYGDLSDIKVKSQDEGTGEVNNTDYPYMFINPAQHTRTNMVMVYRFNLIMMDIVNADSTNSNILKVQSEAQQYIDDILASLYYDMSSQVTVDIDVTLTPFKERFQDTVAGMTASLSITVPQPLNECIVPIDPSV
jgi:hypothetical protein